MRTKRLIGVTGGKGSGKDTAIKQLLDDGFTLIKFADGLKGMLRAYLKQYGESDDTIERMLEGDLKEVACDAFCGRTPRHAMQTLGTEWGRMLIGPKIWTNLFKKRASREEKVVCTDLRFLNESATLVEMKEAGAQTDVVRVVRRKEGAPGIPDMHPSEVEMWSLPVHHTVENTGTKEELRAKLVAIAK